MGPKRSVAIKQLLSLAALTSDIEIFKVRGQPATMLHRWLENTQRPTPFVASPQREPLHCKNGGEMGEKEKQNVWITMERGKTDKGREE